MHPSFYIATEASLEEIKEVFRHDRESTINITDIYNNISDLYLKNDTGYCFISKLTEYPMDLNDSDEKDLDLLKKLINPIYIFGEHTSSMLLFYTIRKFSKYFEESIVFYQGMPACTCGEFIDLYEEAFRRTFWLTEGYVAKDSTRH